MATSDMIASADRTRKPGVSKSIGAEHMLSGVYVNAAPERGPRPERELEDWELALLSGVLMDGA